MAQRRSPIRPTPSSHLTRRNPNIRRSSAARKRALALRLQSPPVSHARPVLVALHPNLRRLPSRLLLAEKDTNMAIRDNHIPVQVGTKRKRVAAPNENAHTHGRPTRGSGRLKRQKSTQSYSSEESESSSMEVDANTRWSASDASDLEPDEDDDDEQDEDADESTDDYLISSAQPNQLHRLRKDELVRLYISAGLTEDAETLTKSEIVDAIISARDDIAELPPSSPPGRGDGNSSEYSSDDGNVAEDETDIDRAPKQNPGPRGFSLRRRATINDLGKTSGRPAKGRSLSMGNLLNNGPAKTPHAVASSSRSVETKRRASSRSSPVLSVPAGYLASPPATRLRSRKISASTDATVTTPISTSSKGSFNNHKGKGKAKQVEFDDDVQVNLTTPKAEPRTPSRKASVRLERERERAREVLEEESDLTELEVLEQSLSARLRGAPSPRRLRSKDKEGLNVSSSASVSAAVGRSLKRVVAEEHQLARRVTPMRKAKGKIGNLKEADEEEDDQLLEEEDEDEAVQEEVDELIEEDAEEEEVDELRSSASISPPPYRGRRTPVKRRLRPRRVQTFTPPSDGDDEEEEEDDEQEGQEDENEADDDAEAEEEVEEAVLEPKRLRNGKIVGEDDVEMEDDDDEEGDEEGDEEADEDEDEDEDVSVDGSVTVDEEDGADMDAEGETDEDEAMEDEDVDLTVATAKTLVRLRRDDLVRLCETRALDVAGTKPQLAEALLQWRDRQGHDFSSPSSVGTIRPPSTVVTRRSKRREDQTPPVLMRNDRVHQDEPRTPPISANNRAKEAEPELELDLESLGLEDREIPPEKITKLEKIGSGGFKDVFIGKFRGRKIAISEFRGQLSAMDIKELKLLGGFDHPNIVRFLGVSIPENTRETPVMIISELCANGDLFDYVRNVSAPSLHKVLCMMLDIASGLEYLHLRKPSVIHRDCKSSNILITSKGTAKIADFGLAKVKQSTRSMVRSLVGTVNWQAPELWHAHPKYNHKVDVFSCAMVYWEMLQWHVPNKKFPWEGMNEHAIYEIVGAKRQRPSISGLRKQWCPEIVDLMERMWAHEHQDRPTMSEVVQELKAMVHR